MTAETARLSGLTRGRIPEKGRGERRSRIGRKGIGVGGEQEQMESEKKTLEGKKRHNTENMHGKGNPQRLKILRRTGLSGLGLRRAAKEERGGGKGEVILYSY